MHLVALPHIIASEPSALKIRIRKSATSDGRIKTRPSEPTPNRTSLKKTERRHGVQIIKKHRDIVPAATAVRDDIPGGVYAGNGICRMKGL